MIARNARRKAPRSKSRVRNLLRRAKVEPFPNVNFMGGYQNQQPGAGPANQGMYQVQIVVPLFNRNQGNIRAAKPRRRGRGATDRISRRVGQRAAEAVGRFVTAKQLADATKGGPTERRAGAEHHLAALSQGQVDFLRYLAGQRAARCESLYMAAEAAIWTAAAEVAGLLQSEQFP